ncbi:MAG: YceI family protein [Chloroflexi bacterium]|nr:MAG: YceI family protein [Chloroflexota bacterium]MBL1196524.1 YceI family protein [Chloroflexota bacterium]NOH13820.1 YceI family protein [Chloroflexota bacterium]
MQRRNLVVTVGVIVLVGIIGAVAVGAYVLRPPAEASGELTAIPIVEEDLPTPVVEVNAGASEGDDTAEEPVAEEGDGDGAFEIVQSESEARFSLGELLSGVPTTVVGVTDQVAGAIQIDLETPANSQVGVIQINARTLVTDSDRRNRAMQNQILDTGSYEFITFSPTAITGMPETITMGESYVFQITGDLTIRDITQSVTFDVAAILVSETRLEGLASATVARADYQLTIPDVPIVADVDEEVLIELEFVAGP